MSAYQSDDELAELELHAHRESAALRAEVERLKAENASLKPAVFDAEADRNLTAAIASAATEDEVKALIRQHGQLVGESQ